MTSDIRAWEREGRYQMIADHTEALTVAPSRLRAARARALAIAGRDEEAWGLIQNILGERCPDTESESIVFLTKALWARRASSWSTALEHARHAQRLARIAGSIDLQGEARFAEALALAEQGALPLASEAFQEVYEDVRLSSYRRELSLANQAWLLWDLGRLNHLANVRSRVAETFRLRLELGISLMEGHTALAQDIALNGVPQLLPESQKDALVLFVTLGLFVLHSPDERSTLGSTWIRPYLQERRVLNQAVAGLPAESLLALLEHKPDLSACRMPEHQHWHGRLYGLLVKCLVISEHDKRAAAHEWRHSLDVACEQLSVRTPLMPRLKSTGFDPESPWSQALQARMLQSSQLT